MSRIDEKGSMPWYCVLALAVFTGIFSNRVTDKI